MRTVSLRVEVGALSLKNFCAVAGARGRLIAEDRRRRVCESLDEGVKQGVRVARLCAALDIHPRTYARWKADPADRRKGSPKKSYRPLSEEEQRQIIEICTSDLFKDTPMGDFVTILAEKSRYIRIQCHSGMEYSTTEQYRLGENIRLFSLRKETLRNAFAKHPKRFPQGGPKEWKSQRVVYLNPFQETRQFIHQQTA